MLICDCLLWRILWQAIPDNTGGNGHKRVKPKKVYSVALCVLTCKVCSLSTHRHPSLACVHRIRLFMISPWTSLSGYNCNNIIVIVIINIINALDMCALDQTVHDFPLDFFVWVQLKHHYCHRHYHHHLWHVVIRFMTTPGPLCLGTAKTPSSSFWWCVHLQLLHLSTVPILSPSLDIILNLPQLTFQYYYQLVLIVCTVFSSVIYHN